MPCLNLGTCSVLCVWMCLNLGISSIFEANLQAFDKSLDDVLPKFCQRSKYLQGFYFTFCTLLKILHKILKIVQKKMGQYKNVFCILFGMPSLHLITFLTLCMRKLYNIAVY